jgi:hypothetical protein
MMFEFRAVRGDGGLYDVVLAAAQGVPVLNRSLAEQMAADLNAAVANGGVRRPSVRDIEDFAERLELVDGEENRKQTAIDELKLLATSLALNSAFADSSLHKKLRGESVAP